MSTFCSRSICFVAKRQIRQSSVNLRIKMATHHQTGDRPAELRTRNPHIDSLPFFLRLSKMHAKLPKNKAHRKNASQIPPLAPLASRRRPAALRGLEDGRIAAADLAQTDTSRRHLTALRLASPETRPRERPLSTGDARALGRRRARLPRARLVRLRRPNRRTDVFRGMDGSRSVLRPSALRGR